VFNQTIAYRDKKVVGVFVHFAPLVPYRICDRAVELFEKIKSYGLRYGTYINYY
jgi:hypothetical protein